MAGVWTVMVFCFFLFFTPGFCGGEKDRKEEKGRREGRKYDADLTKEQGESGRRFMRGDAGELLAGRSPPLCLLEGLVVALPIVRGDVCGFGPFQFGLFVSFALLALRFV